MKKYITLMVLPFILLFACAKKPGEQSIGFSVSTLNNPFFVSLKDGAEKKAAELGYKLIVTDAQDDSSKQINDIDDLIGRKVAVLLINPTDSDAVVSAVESANSAGIPVITLDRAANGGMVASHIASDNVAGGKMAGEFLLSKVGDNAQVIELEGIPGASATRDRGKGFHQAIDGKLTVTAKQTAHFNRVEGLNVTENILQTAPDVKGLFAHNDEMALGALQALEAAGQTDVVVVGFDATDEAVDAVKNGKMAGTVAQRPSLIGELGVFTADKIIKGMTVEKTIAVPLKLIK